MLRSLLVLGERYSADGKVFRSRESALRANAVASESLCSWFGSVHLLTLMTKPVLQVLKSLLVVGGGYSAGGKVFVSIQSAPHATAVYSECLY